MNQTYASEYTTDGPSEISIASFIKQDHELGDDSALQIVVTIESGGQLHEHTFTLAVDESDADYVGVELTEDIETFDLEEDLPPEPVVTTQIILHDPGTPEGIEAQKRWLVEAYDGNPHTPLIIREDAGISVERRINTAERDDYTAGLHIKDMAKSILAQVDANVLKDVGDFGIERHSVADWNLIINQAAGDVVSAVLDGDPEATQREIKTVMGLYIMLAVEVERVQGGLNVIEASRYTGPTA